MGGDAPETGHAVQNGPASKGLKSDALGLASSVVVGLAGTAPAYSLAATIGFIVAVVGVQAPAAMLLAFVPTLFVAVACQQLNQATPDCGMTFAWSAAAFGPTAGWLGGWAIIVTDVIVMANLGQVAGQYGFLLLGSAGLAQSALWTTVAGVIWIAASTWLCYRGIELSVRTQYVLLGFELVALILFSVIALVRVYSGDAPEGSVRPALSWMNPFAVGSTGALAGGVLLAVFVYWGWDALLAMNEEIADRERTPGRAALLSTLLLLVTYLLVTVAAVAYAGIGRQGLGLGNPKNSGDVLAALSNSALGGGLLSKLLVLSTITSVAASIQTTILPTARVMLSMGTYGALPRVFTRIHPLYRTPTVSTLAIGAVAILYYAGLTAISAEVLSDSLKSISLGIAFYYALTAFACVWYFRRTLLQDLRSLMLRGVLPLLGGLMLVGALVKSAEEMLSVRYGLTSFAGVGGVFLLGVGPLLLGLLLMLAHRAFAPQYFRSREPLRIDGRD